MLNYWKQGLTLRWSLLPFLFLELRDLCGSVFQNALPAPAADETVRKGDRKKNTEAQSPQGKRSVLIDVGTVLGSPSGKGGGEGKGIHGLG